MKCYFIGKQLYDLNISKATRFKLQNLILKICNYKYCTNNKRKEIKGIAQKLSKIHSKPIYIFRGIIEFLEEERVIILGYSVMQNIIGSTIIEERARLSMILQKRLSQEIKETLSNLLQNPQTLYEITILKKEPKDFNYNEILQEIKRAERIKDLYYSTKNLLKKLEISNENIKYYASLVDYYSVFQLKQFNIWTAYLHLLCFINHRYRKLDDNLIESLIYYVRKYEKDIIPARYEFLVYKLLRNNIESGDIFCKDSTKYCHFNDDLIADEEFERKEQLIEDTRLFILKAPIKEILSSFKERIENQIPTTNQNILDENNPSITIRKYGKDSEKVDWKFHYVSLEENISKSYFDNLGQIPVQEILETVDKHCNFLDSFHHILGRYAKQYNDKIFIACLIAFATNMGLGKMGQISDVDHQELSTTAQNFIYPENLKRANDVISNYTATLDIFPYYNIDDIIHSSSDGQKFETSIHIINSRCSKKYFGLQKGVSSYNMITNNIPVNAKIIGANDHESHHVFDIIYNNTSDIQPKIYSTDSHGVNNANDLILYIFGYQFAPRYKDIKSKTANVYGFKTPSSYDRSFLIKPSHKVNENLIVDEWENMQRIFLSLALKTTTQSNIISKLSSHKRKNKTQKAIWEFNSILTSLYIYQYLDNISLQRNVQKSLNRGELYHRLCRTIKYINSGKFKSISPISWQHINFHGKYEFMKKSETINIDSIVRKMMKESHNKTDDFSN